MLSPHPTLSTEAVDATEADDDWINNDLSSVSARIENGVKSETHGQRLHCDKHTHGLCETVRAKNGHLSRITVKHAQ